MIDKLIYLTLIIVLGFFYFKTNKKLREKYFIDKSMYYSGIFFIVPVIAPKAHFKKKDFWKGYSQYIFHLIYIFGVAYFLLKLVEVL